LCHFSLIRPLRLMSTFLLFIFFTQTVCFCLIGRPQVLKLRFECNSHCQMLFLSR
jgi:hypothetical protein